MGSTMRPVIFNERVITALKKWRHNARKHIKENKKSGQVSPMSSRPGTPSSLSPVHLLAHYRSNIENLQISPTRLNLNNENWDVRDGSPSTPTYPLSRDSTCHHEIELSYTDGMDQVDEPSSSSQEASCSSAAIEIEHDVTIQVSKDFSFDKRPNI